MLRCQSRYKWQRFSNRAAKIACAADIRGSIDPTSPTSIDAEPGAIVEVRGPRNRMLGHALFSDQSQITIRMISRDDDADRRGVLARAARGGDPLPRHAADQRHRVSPRARRGRPAAVADRRSLRRLPRDADPVAGDGSPGADAGEAAGRDHRREGHPRAQRSEGPHARRPRAEGRSAATARCPKRSASTKPASPTRSIRGAGRRPACFSISARTAKPPRVTRTAGCSTASATTAASAWSLASHCESVEALDVSADAVERITANAAGQRHHQPHRARSQRLRRAAPPRTRRRPLRHHRPGSPGVREEQGLDPERAGRLQGDQPPRAAVAEPGRIPRSPAAAPTTWTRRCSPRRFSTPPPTPISR